MGKASRTKGRRTGPAKRGSGGGWLLVGGVLAVIAVMAVVFVTSEPEAVVPDEQANAALAQILDFPVSTLDAVGVDALERAPTPLPAGTPEITADGKPVVMYVGAEFCPYCASERWPFLIALSRFGRFSGIGTTYSEPPFIHSVSFSGSSYESDHIVVWAKELATRTGAPLDTLDPDQQRIWDTYGQGSFPFVLIGNLYSWSGASYSKDILAGLSFDEIVAHLADPADPITATVGATANAFTAAICQLTGGQPTDVCQSPGVVAAQARLPQG